MKKTSYFNEENPLNAVLKKIECEVWEKKPEEIDLRFFTKIFFSDTFNGRAACLHGTQYRAVLYGNRVVWDWQKLYVNGGGGWRDR